MLKVPCAVGSEGQIPVTFARLLITSAGVQAPEAAPVRLPICWLVAFIPSNVPTLSVQLDALMPESLRVTPVENAEEGRSSWSLLGYSSLTMII